MKPSKKKLLVTGATGFVGRALCRQLLQESWQVRVLLRNPAMRVRLPTALRAEAVLGDMLDQKSLQEACADIDIVLHLAGKAHAGNSSEAYCVNSNEAATENLLAAARQQRVRRIVFLSSSLAHAAQTNEGDVTNYGKGKLAAEALLSKAESQEQIEAVILRAVNVYGVGMKGNIAAMISMIHSGRLPRLPALSSRLSLLAVEDLARALILAAKTAAAAGRTYTVTDGQVYAISELEAAIYQALGKTLPRWRTPVVVVYAASALAGLLARSGLCDSSISTRTYRNLSNDNLFENEAICKELGFRPSGNLYKALPSIVASIVEKTVK